jgi:TolB-like protein
MRDMVVDLRHVARQTVETRAPVGRSRRWITMAAAALVILALGGAALWRTRPTATDAARIRSLAVLPLQNLSRDPDQDFFSDGTTEALISNLAQIHDLDVISRTSVMHYKGTTKTVPQIGRELSVDAILEGSIQRVGGRVRITAQLIRASTDRHLWAREYERDAADVLSLEAEIARTIAQEIQANLTPEETRRLGSARSIRPDAHDAYLLGRYHMEKHSMADLRQAIEQFDLAIRLQPDFAAAYAGRSRASFLLLQAVSLLTGTGSMRADAAKAIELDPNLGEAHQAMSWIRSYDWDWAGAESELRRAVELNPEAERDLVNILSITGRHAQAVAAAEHAAKVDPLSSEAKWFYGAALFFARRYEDALGPLKRAIEIEPRNNGAIIMLGVVYEALGRTQEALAVFDRPDYRESAYTARAYALLGRRDDALRLLNGLVKKGEPRDLQEVAIVYFTLGDRNRGFEWLTKAFDRRGSFVVAAAKVQPAFDGIRNDPRFKALVARLNLPE